MLIGSNHMMQNYENTCKINVTLDGRQIEETCNVKYLGMTLDRCLNWGEHTSILSSKVRPLIVKLRRLSTFLSKATLNTIYRSYIQPHLDYCITVWGGCPMSNLKIIQSLQNLAARITAGNFDYVSTRGIDIVNKLEWFNVKERYEYMMSCLIYKCINGMAPVHLCNSINKISDLNIRENRSININDLYKPHFKHKYMDMSFQSAGPKIWNKLPSTIKSSKTLKEFKHKYKSHIFPV
jgi:hypothetical protein